MSEAVLYKDWRRYVTLVIKRKILKAIRLSGNQKAEEQPQTQSPVTPSLFTAHYSPLHCRTACSVLSEPNERSKLSAAADQCMVH